MAAPVHNKYYLKTLHEEIDLFDRKLAHLLKYEEFKTDAARNTSASKMQAKRDLLVRTARLLASEGIEFKDSDLPRSFRTEDPTAASTLPGEPIAEAESAEPEDKDIEQVAVHTAAQARPMPSPFAGTVLDGRASLDAYKRSRTRLPGSSPRA